MGEAEHIKIIALRIGFDQCQICAWVYFRFFLVCLFACFYFCCIDDGLGVCVYMFRCMLRAGLSIRALGPVPLNSL